MEQVSFLKQVEHLDLHNLNTHMAKDLDLLITTASFIILASSHVNKLLLSSKSHFCFREFMIEVNLLQSVHP